MNRHGISQNPTREESALLRKLWAGDDARANASREYRRGNELEAENVRLRAEVKRLAADALEGEQP